MERIIRNGKFVGQGPSVLSLRHLQAISELVDKLHTVFPSEIYEIVIECVSGSERNIVVKLSEKVMHEKIIRIKGKGSFAYGRDTSKPTELVLNFSNEEGYANDPFYSGDYETKESQMQLYVRCRNIVSKDRWSRQWCTYEPQPHFAFAYEVEDMAEDILYKSLKNFIDNAGKLFSGINKEALTPEIFKADSFHVTGIRQHEADTMKVSLEDYNKIKNK